MHAVWYNRRASNRNGSLIDYWLFHNSLSLIFLGQSSKSSAPEKVSQH